MYDGGGAVIVPDGLRQLPVAFVQVALLKVMFESTPAPPNAHAAYPFGLMVNVLAVGSAAPR